MPTSYTTSLGLALPATGELSGTWGDEVNNYITQYLDSAVAGTQTISGTQTAVTINVDTGTPLVQVNGNPTGAAQFQIINCTGNPSGTLVITAPSISKSYILLNNTATSRSVTIKATTTTGVTVAAGRAALVAWNGTDFELVATDDASKLSGVLAAVNGGTGQSSYAVGDLLYADTSTTLAKLADVATGNALISGGVGAAPSYGKIGLTTHVTGTLSVANGGTGQTTFTDGQLLIGSTSGNTLTKTTLTAGSGVTITNGSGAITIAATGSGGTVTSVSGSGTVNGLTLTGTVTSSGSLTLGGTLSGVDLTSQVTGTLPIANGGTGQTGTPTNGQLLIGNGTGFVRAALTQGTGITITNGSGSVTVTNAGVTSLSGTSNQVSVSASTGSITLSTPQSIGTSSSVQFGSLGVGTSASGTTGEIRATNNVTAYFSDERLKTRLSNIENALDKVCQLSGFFYHANEVAVSLGYDVKQEVGVSAQEVQKVMPEVVAPAPIDDKYLTVRYERLVPLLIEAIKELRAEINALKGV